MDGNKKYEEIYIECPNCERSIKKENVICPYCQYNLEDGAELEKEHFYEKKWFWIIAVIVIVVFVIANSNKSEKSNKNDNSTTNSITNNQKNDSNITSKTNSTIEKRTVSVVDFSQMSKEEIKNWCAINALQCNFTEVYSDIIKKGEFVSQNIAANMPAYEGNIITITYSKGKEPTTGQKNALSTAKSYLAYTAFSYSGLIKQLEYEGFPKEEAVYGVDNCGADWKEQAAKMAKSYMNYSSFSRKGLIEQLKYEGFTNEQSEYGASTVGY